MSQGATLALSLVQSLVYKMHSHSTPPSSPTSPHDLGTPPRSPRPAMQTRTRKEAYIMQSNQELLLRIKQLEDSQRCQDQEIARLNRPAQMFWRSVLFIGLLKLYNMSLADSHGVSLPFAGARGRSTPPPALATDDASSGESGVESSGGSRTSPRPISPSRCSSSAIHLRKVPPPSSLPSSAVSQWAIIFDEGNLLDTLRQFRNTAAHEATAKDLKDAIIYLDGGVPMQLVLLARLSFETITGCQWNHVTSQHYFDDGARALKDAIRAKHAVERARQNVPGSPSPGTPSKKRKADGPPTTPVMSNARVTIPVHNNKSPTASIPGIESNFCFTFSSIPMPRTPQPQLAQLPHSPHQAMSLPGQSHKRARVQACC